MAELISESCKKCCVCSCELKEEFKEYETSLYCCGCFEEDFGTCAGCSEILPRDDGRFSDLENRFYCESCYTDAFTHCYNCDCEIYQDDAHCTNDGHFCEDCYEEHGCCEEEEEEHHLKHRFEQSEQFTLNPYKRFVGVELECEEGSLNIDSTPDGVYRYFSFVHDGSLDNSGVEAVSIAMNGDLLFNKIQEATTYLHDCGFSVNKSCGLHIHIDSRDLSEQDLKKVYLLYSVFEDNLYSIVSPSRRNNSYCKKLPKEFNELLDKSLKTFWYKCDSPVVEKYHSSRYHFLNFNSHFYRGTIEVRLHNGTLSYDKIQNWILINLKLVEYALKTSFKRLMNLKSSIKTFCNVIHEPKLVKYIKQRRSKFFGRAVPKRPIWNVKARLDALTQSVPLAAGVA